MSGSHGPEHVCVPPVAIFFFVSPEKKKKCHSQPLHTFRIRKKNANVDRLDQQHRNAHTSFFLVSFREMPKRTRAARAVVRTPLGERAQYQHCPPNSTGLLHEHQILPPSDCGSTNTLEDQTRAVIASFSVTSPGK